jgi:hypothetical protein
MTLLERLAAIKTRTDAATPGSWIIVTRKRHFPQWAIVCGEELIADQLTDAASTEFIAHARTDLPLVVEALEVALEALRAPVNIRKGFSYQEHQDALAKIERLLVGGGE